jgi:hypothetical protein
MVQRSVQQTRLAPNLCFEPCAIHANFKWRSSELPVAAILEIDDDGELTSTRSDRYRDLGRGQSVLAWIAQCSEYRTFSGFHVPTNIAVAWEIDQQQFSYARFRVTTLEYNFAHRF